MDRLEHDSPLAQMIAPLDLARLADSDQRAQIGLHTGSSALEAIERFDWTWLVTCAAAMTRKQDIKVTTRRNPVPHLFFTDRKAIDRAKLEALIARGASVILPNLQRHDPALAAIAREWVAASGEDCWIGAIGSKGESGALTRHRDKVDLFILQTEGRKAWRIYGNDEHAPAPTFECILSPGDYLFLPAGEYHECETLDGSSLHLGLGLAPEDYATFDTD